MKNDFFKAASIRAIKTIAQTLLSLITVGQAISDIDWVTILSVSVVAGFVSILTSVATGLPETNIDGELVIEQNEEGTPILHLNLDELKDGMKILIKDSINIGDETNG